MLVIYQFNAVWAKIELIIIILLLSLPITAYGAYLCRFGENSDFKIRIKG